MTDHPAIAGALITEGMYKGKVGYIWKASDKFYHIKVIHEDGFAQYMTVPKDRVLVVSLPESKKG